MSPESGYKQIETERFPAVASVALLLTHGRSGRLLLTRHGVLNGEQECWGPIAGGIEKGEIAWLAALREAKEEANINPDHIIFVSGKNELNPHVALIPREDKLDVGLVYDVTYSGPKVPLEGWDITEDKSVDRVKFFSWKEVLKLLDNKSSIYKPEFNYPQLLRWTLMRHEQNHSSRSFIESWLINNKQNIPGLYKNEVNNSWNYYPPYNNWMITPHIHGNPEKTNFARQRYLEKH